MANNLQHSLDVMEVNNKQAKDALRIVLHTILFNRSLGAVTPKELTVASFPDVTFPTCDDPEIDKSVEEGIEKFVNSLQIVGPDLVRGELVLSFFDTKKRSGFLGIGAATEEKVYWERWAIPMIVNRGSLQTVSAISSLRSNLFKILHLASDLTHIPRFKGGSEQSVVYRFDICIAQNKAGDNFFNQILTNGPPLSLRFSTS